MAPPGGRVKVSRERSADCQTEGHEGLDGVLRTSPRAEEGEAGSPAAASNPHRGASRSSEAECGNADPATRRSTTRPGAANIAQGGALALGRGSLRRRLESPSGGASRSNKRSSSCSGTRISAVLADRLPPPARDEAAGRLEKRAARSSSPSRHTGTVAARTTGTLVPASAGTAASDGQRTLVGAAPRAVARPCCQNRWQRRPLVVCTSNRGGRLSKGLRGSSPSRHTEPSLLRRPGHLVPASAGTPDGSARSSAALRVSVHGSYG